MPILSYGLEQIIIKHLPLCDVYRANSLVELEDYCNALLFDIVFLDISFNGFAEYSIIKKTRIIQNKATLIIFSSNNETKFNELCFQYGGNAVLSKQCSEENITQVLNVFLLGGTYFTKKVKLFLDIKKSTNKNKLISNSINTLSTREFELALMMVSGVKGIDIAKSLNIACSTVSTYKKRIFVKTSTTNVLELALVFNASSSTK